MENPLVSVIIVTYNSSEYVRSLLDSLLKISYNPVEIIVWDNNSTDRTSKILDSYKGSRFKIFLSGKNLGFAGGNNYALKETKGKLILLLNSDTIVRSNFLETLVERIQSNEKIAAVQPLVYLMKNRTSINLTGKVTQFLGFDWIKDYKKRNRPLPGEITSFSGSAILIKRAVLEKTKFFDPVYFMYHEDTDLSWRMRLFGYHIFFEPKSVVYHDYKYIPKEAYQSLKNKMKYYERNRISTIFKNYSSKTLIVLFPAFLLIEVAMLIFSVLNGWLKEKIIGYVDNIKNMRHLLKERHFIQTNRKISDNQIIKDYKAELVFEKFQILPIRIVVNPFLRAYWFVARFLI